MRSISAATSETGMRAKSRVLSSNILSWKTRTSRKNFQCSLLPDSTVSGFGVLMARFILLGIEKMRIVPGITATNALDLYYMPYTHSLVGALFWSAAAFVIYKIGWREIASNAAALLVGFAVFYHWLLDLIVHRPD